MDGLRQAKAVVDGLVHAGARMDPPAAARHAAFIATHLAMGIAALCSLPAYLALRGTISLAEALTFAVLAAAIPIALYVSRTGRLVEANGLSSLAACGLIAILAVVSGGLSSRAVMWLPLVPLAALLGGSRAVVSWSGIGAVATAGLVGVLDVAGYAASPGTALPWELQAVAVIAAVAYAGGLALLTHGLETFGAEMTRLGHARYTLLAENMQDVVACHGPGGRVIYVSPGGEAMAGAPVATLLGHGLFERVHVADRPAYLEGLSAAAEGEARTAEFRLRHGDTGTRFGWIEMRCHREIGAEGVHVVSVLRDIADRKAHDGAVEAARAEAEKANAAKSRFLATMSHELRTPLNAVIGFSEMLMQESELRLDAARRTEYAALIRDSGHHLLSVVNSILDMSKIESGNFAIEPEPFAVRGLLEGVRGMMALKAQAGAVDLAIDVPPGLPDLVADKRACRQICLNLVSNAVKFTPAGGQVAIGARLEGEAMALWVADTGIGLSREDAHRLGEAFFQARSAYDRPFEGTGLGLSIVKGLAALHGGTMEVESALGRGTTVTVRLPLVCENALPASAEPADNVQVLRPRTASEDQAAGNERQGKRRA